MDTFFPFIHKTEKKKKDDGLQPLYIELEAPPVEREKKNDEEETPRVIIIEL